MILGIDFGNTMVVKLDGVQYEVYGAMDAIEALDRRGVTMHIISKVNEKQKEEVDGWLDRHNVYTTLIPRSNVHWCAERKEKGAICKRLGITHHIDDRPEVMASLDPSIKKFLLDPEKDEVIEFFNQMVNTKIFYSWNAILRELWKDLGPDIRSMSVDNIDEMFQPR